MTNELRSRTEVFTNALAALDASRAALSDARDWLVSDWTPVGAALTSEAGEARRTLLANIGNAKNLIDAMQQDPYQAIASLENQR